MNPPNSLHPTDQALGDYGLGRLGGESADAIHAHLEDCAECRGRVAGLTSDSFLGRFRDAQKPSSGPAPAGSIADGTLSFDRAGASSPRPSAETLPPGLADHPDYEIRRELGRGGMGVVYLAHNTMMGRDEVLKVIGRHIMERPSVLERFQREIRAVAKLRHPNIVAAHSAFRIEGGLVFAMEHVEGLDLSRLVKAKGPLPVAHAAYFIHQAALGLQHAHERGMVHRDIKPHNLMLTHDGKARVVKILDFGLAKASREGTRDSGLTNEGQMLGTPDFIAPEQIRDAQSADIRADIYSLGCTLFYLLTGRAPFQAALLYDVLQAHFSMDAEPLNLIRPEVPAELAALASKMMAKDPDRRFQAPGEVAQALTPFFKKASTSPKTDLSAPAPRPAEVPGPRPKARAPIPGEAAATTEAEAPWAALIDTEEAASPARPLPGARPPGRPDGPRRARPAMAAALALLGLVALGIFIIGIKTKDAEVTIENPTPGTTLTVKPGGDLTIVAGKDEAAIAARVARLAAALEKPIPMHFATDTPLSDVLKYLKDATQAPGDPGTPAYVVPIYVDPSGLQEVDRTMASTISIDLSGPPLKTTLRRLLKQLNLDYRTREGLLFISSSVEVEEAARTLPEPTRNPAPEDRAILAAIERPITLNFSDDTPLEDVIRYLKEALGTPASPAPVGWIYVDPQGLQAADKTMASTINIDLEGVPLRISLELILRQVGLGYHVKDGLLTITYIEPAQGPKKAAEAPPAEGRADAEAPPTPPAQTVGPTGPAGPKAQIVGGNWSVEGDELVQTWTGGAATLLLGKPDWSNYDLSFDFKAVENGDGAWATFHYLDNDNNIITSFGLWKNTRHGISKAIEGKVSRESIPGRIEPGRWYAARIEVRGPEASCFLDGVPVARYLDPRLQRGRVGIGGYHASVRFRNIEVRTPEGKPLFVGIPRI